MFGCTAQTGVGSAETRVPFSSPPQAPTTRRSFGRPPTVGTRPALPSTTTGRNQQLFSYFFFFFFSLPLFLLIFFAPSPVPCLFASCFCPRRSPVRACVRRGVIVVLVASLIFFFVIRNRNISVLRTAVQLQLLYAVACVIAVTLHTNRRRRSIIVDELMYSVVR